MGTIGRPPGFRRRKERLDAIGSRMDLTLEDVYELGLEHDRENLFPDGEEPDAGPQPRGRPGRGRVRENLD